MPMAVPAKRPDSNQKIIGKNGPPKRLYQVWKGSNRFFLGGRFIFGPDVKWLLLTVLLIVVPVILFTVFVSQKLVNDFQKHLGILVIALPVAFATHVLVLLFLTSSGDPGIIPRSAHPPEPENDGCSSDLSLAGSPTAPRFFPLTKDVLVNGIVMKVKYCHTCMLYRPPRCSHCSICNNCVDRFDHHCPWVGQCIGKRNYLFFFMFLSSTTLLCLYVFVFCLLYLKKIMQVHECNLWKALLKSPSSGVLILYTFIATWFVGGLSCFHLYLICTNQTTYENFRYRYDKKKNPFDLGCASNVIEVLFSKIPKSRNDFRAMVIEESAGFTSRTHNHIMSLDVLKTSFDLEMGWKRQAVLVEEVQDVQLQIKSARRLKRSNTHPPADRSLSSHSSSHCDISPDRMVDQDKYQGSPSNGV